MSHKNNVFAEVSSKTHTQKCDGKECYSKRLIFKYVGLNLGVESYESRRVL